MEDRIMTAPRSRKAGKGRSGARIRLPHRRREPWTKLLEKYIGRVVLTGLTGYNDDHEYYVFGIRRQGTVF